MKEFFTVTKEHIERAKSYMPLGEKGELARQIAFLCVNEHRTAEQNKAGERLLAMPHMKYEDAELKSILLLNTFLGFYLDIELNEENENGEKIDSYDQYDYYAGGHILNQMERMKSDPQLRNKVFDIIADYKDFKRMVEIEIANLKENNNDVLGRFTAAVSILSDSQNIKALAEELINQGNAYADKLKESGIVSKEDSAAAKQEA